MKTKESFFTESDEARLIEAIKNAENTTSGEIKVHVEENCFIDLLDRTAEVFAKLKMHETKARNGVLIYIAFEDHLFSIIGDKGVNSVVDPNYWEEVRDAMSQHFSSDDLIGGLEAGITEVGKILKDFFPHQDDDENELPDEISYG